MTLPPSCSSRLYLPRLGGCRPLPACLVFASILIFLLLFKIKVVPSLPLLFSVESYILPSANISHQTWWPLFCFLCGLETVCGNESSLLQSVLRFLLCFYSLSPVFVYTLLLLSECWGKGSAMSCMRSMFRKLGHEKTKLESHGASRGVV